MKKPYFPIFMDISKYKIIVVGGGRVAQRRIETLFRFAEDITVIAPEITERLKELWEQKKFLWKNMAYDESMDEILEEADMVLAATDDDVCNEHIACVCGKPGILVNVSHRKELCDFYFPAVVARENIVAGVTASGLDHAQAKHIRKCIEYAVDEEMKKFL